MSTTASSDGSAPVKEECPEPLDKTTCRVDASAASAEDLDHSIVPLIGDVPSDSPYWGHHVEGDPRGLGAKTMRFVSSTAATLIPRVDIQDKARDAIWSKLRRMLPSHAVPRGLPSVVFNEQCLVDGTRRGVIDLVFPCFAAWDACEDLDELHIEEVDGETLSFDFLARTRGLAGNILPVQCIGLPIDELDPRALLKALTIMSSAVGPVIGLAKIVVESEKWQVGEQYSGAVRFWIDIEPENMSISWSRLIKKLPTHFRCNGFPYALSYANRELHEENVFSSIYTIPRTGENDSKALIKRSRTSDEGANSSTSRRKKVKKQEEEEEEEA